MKTVAEIIKKAGGMKLVARETGIKKAVYLWPKSGIPDRHWAAIMNLAPDLSPTDIYQANRLARGEIKALSP